MNVSDLLDHLRQVLGRDLSPRIDKYAVINHAGQLLVSCRAWNWALRPPAELQSVGGRTYLLPPADFTELLDIKIKSSVSGCMRPCPLSEITDLRSITSVNVDTGFFYRYAVASAQNDTTDGGSPRWRIELWPTPQSAGTFLLTYRGGWTQLAGSSAKNTDSDSDEIPIPFYVEGLYLEILNAVALGRMRPESGSTSKLLAEVLLGPVAAIAFQMDLGAQRNMGKARAVGTDYSHIKDQMPVNIAP